MPVLSVRTGTPYPPWRDPREATRLLRYALRRHGFTHTYQSNGNGMSVLSVLADLTVWCRSGLFIWNEEGRGACHPADDPAGAARLISRHHRRPIFGDIPSGGRTGSMARPSPVTGSVRD
ncbi:hypothetical protein GCM10017600_78370 [Streptosporangium carneum]|uniref:Uncharacterized protein n=1 Tax=Streptosporangium carneum TaxID=47481 RepID=A0A9W6MHP6_9ACTN|nr:hypothetical protein GCM10017600_78370 [Streptosporangium carneum]